MLLKGDQLAAHLERGLRPLYVLYGDEPLLVIEAADAIRLKAPVRQPRPSITCSLASTV